LTLAPYPHCWTLTDYSALTDRVPLASVECTLAVAEVYDKLEIA
jgi:hypothetical protein